MKTIKRIVFTGGPCSGKTTFTSRAQQVFGERGYRVIIDNESATDLISGGISPATMGMYEFQKYCIDLQLKKEELCYKAAEEISGEKVLIFIDRGILDDRAYVSDEEFEQIIDVKKVNPKNATLPEMRALEAYSGASKRLCFSSLPMGTENVGLNQRQDFISAFKQNVVDMNMLGEYGIAQEYNKLLSFYEMISWK